MVDGGDGEAAGREREGRGLSLGNRGGLMGEVGENMTEVDSIGVGMRR